MHVMTGSCADAFLTQHGSSGRGLENGLDSGHGHVEDTMR
jgi:hypothetical protein